MRHSLIASIFAFLSLGAGAVHAEDALRDQAKGLFEPIPKAAPALPGNPATPEKLALGKMLYFEPRLSGRRDMSCATCHNLTMSGVDAIASSQLAGRDVLTVLNAVFNKSQYWDGRTADLQDQVVNSVMANPKAVLKTRGGPMAINPVELAATKQLEIDQLKAVPSYVEAFKTAFPGEADPLVYDNIGKAIAVFEATLITPDSAFDRWLTGDDAALDDTQKAGLKLFIDKGCAACHNGVNIGGASYAKFGVVANPGPEYLPSEDAGRYAVTKNNADRYVFKVPSLRNVEMTPPYFHTGSTFDLKKAVTVMAETQLGAKLSDDEATKVVAFLKTLTGKQPEIVLPVLPPRDR
ncbi:c-type cytochrome [Methylocystis sp. MJC1]|jgi:cytochrome c peroxidase|uniref:cytochrome-c peroxidase n=1 Tax=Methylocystis sp. MJC1 TaxID=2654282 RepID=UPI0013EBB6E9|nr:cytochrome c peroxidase [Methylocystis sp. MJC1]KAF2989688.1 Cytochrome c551 peroxidase [Methylocystis sp. MJC1]MBU6525604.1 c-type cytochrome [Methylocystis sp. MJC1]UZX12080.1 c-type cytochrome [Methylocystis sp. MJC1]